MRYDWVAVLRPRPGWCARVGPRFDWCVILQYFYGLIDAAVKDLMSVAIVRHDLIGLPQPYRGLIDVLHTALPQPLLTWLVCAAFFFFTMRLARA